MFKKNLIKGDCISLRCCIRQDGSQFIASCLDLCLAAQAGTMQDAKRLLHLQILDMIQDELRDGVLAPRPAPLSEWIVYFAITFRVKLNLMLGKWSAFPRQQEVFRDQMSRSRFVGA